ncbi:hypothetical protein IX51_09750 [uncultured archaeon]|nr:hypothetical protein IX51_09750 [uncultured archaeon]
MYSYDRIISKNGKPFYTKEGIAIGEDYRKRSIRMPEQMLEGHLLILGKSGTGKSNLIFNLVNQIGEVDGPNIILFDPHGTLLNDVVLSNTGNDLIYLSPGIIMEDGRERAVSFNTISTGSGEQEDIDRTTGWLRDMMANEEAFSNGSWGPRLEVIFRVVLAELIRQHDGANLEYLAQTLTSRQNMKNFISSVSDESTRKFLEGQYQDWKSWTQYISSTMNRLLPLLSTPSTKYLISGKEDSVDLYKELKRGNSLVALNISKSSFSDEVIKIVSSLFLMKIWTSILDGFRKTHEKISTYVIIDEFQSIPAAIIENLLREGRKFGIRVILASQYIDSGSEQLMQAVFGNVRNYISFNLSDRDAGYFARMAPNGGRSKELAETVKEQKLHRAVIISQTREGPAGPLSFTPFFEEPARNYEKVEKMKRESMIRYSADIVKEAPQTINRSLHEKIIDTLESVLGKNGIEISRSTRINGSIADASFHYSGNEYIVEVEVSDVSRKSRVLSKLKSYPGKNIILVCPQGQGEVIHSMISDPTRYRVKNGFVVEFPLSDGGRDIYARDVAPSIKNTWILEYCDNGLKSYWNGKGRRFLLKHLLEAPTFQRELNNGEYAEAKNYLFRLMLSSETFALKKRDVIDNGVIKKAFMNEFIRKNCEKESEFVFMKDLFGD